MQLRNIREQDYGPIISVIDHWWGGRRMADMLPRLFFQHFQDTSFVVEENGRIIAFLVGFVSQSQPEQAYIHFVGVHPEFRQRGLACQLYDRFFAVVRERGCREVRCITSPANQSSIAFHTAMGFEIEPGDAEVDGVQVTTDYDGRGGDRVRFVRKVGCAAGESAHLGDICVP
ncbi:GNAT family N-acetyltransferase [Alicyclobacillus shizuokensis]|uniref:GNAT family N-acetyltransferase n=1 Tax=Alicyclobacillus shizuokensis TaxID=392014 RepID=UPI00082A4994|nr:GNAT family N-acetyltransferase [Alicyclobacillus shizuokensis]